MKIWYLGRNHIVIKRWTIMRLDSMFHYVEKSPLPLGTEHMFYVWRQQFCNACGFIRSHALNLQKSWLRWSRPQMKQPFNCSLCPIAPRNCTIFPLLSARCCKTLEAEFTFLEYHITNPLSTFHIVRIFAIMDDVLCLVYTSFLCL